MDGAFLTRAHSSGLYIHYHCLLPDSFWHGSVTLLSKKWKKWKELSGVLCDRRMPVAVKGKVYRTLVRPVLIYGSETWTMKRREEERLQRTEMRMLRWILGLTLRDKKRNDCIPLSDFQGSGAAQNR